MNIRNTIYDIIKSSGRRPLDYKEIFDKLDILDRLELIKQELSDNILDPEIACGEGSQDVDWVIEHYLNAIIYGPLHEDYRDIKKDDVRHDKVSKL